MNSRRKFIKSLGVGLVGLFSLASVLACDEDKKPKKRKAIIKDREMPKAIAVHELPEAPSITGKNYSGGSMTITMFSNGEVETIYHDNKTWFR